MAPIQEWFMVVVLNKIVVKGVQGGGGRGLYFGDI